MRITEIFGLGRAVKDDGGWDRGRERWGDRGHGNRGNWDHGNRGNWGYSNWGYSNWGSNC